MKIKHIIGGVLITLGMFLAFAAVGHLDYLDERGEHYGVKEVREMAVKSMAGLAAAGIGVILCRNIEIEADEDKPSDKKENRAD